MSNTYDTSMYPLGSTHPKVLFNNASNLDDGSMNNVTSRTWVDRFGRLRKSWWGFEQDFNDFLVNSGFEPNHLTYVDGVPLQVDRPTQLIDRAGSVYRVKMPATFPVMLSGTWATDEDLLVDVGDAALRQALALSTGATLIGTADYPTLQENLDVLKSGLSVNPLQFGAVGDGVTDDTTAVQDAITFAQDNGGFLALTRRHLVSATLNQTKRLTVQGNGKYTSGIIYSGSGDAWVATPPFAGASNTDWNWRNFGIVPSVAGGGQYGLRLKLQAATGGAVCFMADSQVWGMFIGDFGAQGLYIDNSVANVDGFFTSQFMFNTVVNGILGMSVGDSLNFSHNKIYGRNCGIEMTGVAGARQMIIDDNNITTTGGLLALLNVEEPTIRDCQLEHPGYLSGYTGIYGAAVLLYNCFKPRVEGNTINGNNGAASAPVSPGLVATTLALTGNTSGAFITQNDIQKGSVDHIAVGASTVTDTVIDDLNTYYGAAGVITDAGTRTRLPTLRGSTAYAATLSNGTATGEVFAVPGASFAYEVEAWYSAGSQGVEMRGWVSAAGVVTVRLENNTGGTVNLSGGSILVRLST